jgi:AcrR family transcriptional regulator
MAVSPRTARRAPDERRRPRRSRERDIVIATRALFDERGMQDAPIDEIARAVGINKALIYRHFSSKEELFVLTVTLYLDDLAERLEGVDASAEPVARLREGWERYADFCLEYPAFLDCALSLMRRPARELRERVSEAVWFRLGQAMSACLGPLERILADGVRSGAFTIDDPAFVANRLYVQTLGTMHLARVGVGVRQAGPGIPDPFPVAAAQVRDACVEDALAAVGARARPQPPGRSPSVAVPEPARRRRATRPRWFRR